MEALRFGEKLFAEIRMRDGDQGNGPLAHRLAEQIGDAEFGHDVVDIGADERHPFAGEQLRPDARFGFRRRSSIGRQTIGLPPTERAAPRWKSICVETPL